MKNQDNGISQKNAEEKEIQFAPCFEVGLKRGLLLINLGTPEECSISAVRRFLKEFLTDKRVVSLPAFLRYLLLHAIILPFRTRKTTTAYQQIWQKEGSPLLIHSQQLQNKLQEHLGNTWKVVLGMRYGRPSLNSALNTLQDCKSITILPLYPQYSSSATGSAIQQVFNLIASQAEFPSLYFIRDFYKNPAFIEAQASLIQPHMDSHDFILFSYHSIPVNHLSQHCKTPCTSDCVISNKTSLSYFKCYRAQCHFTSQALAKTLQLDNRYYTTSFQSRIGKTPWIKPFTDEILPKLIQQGIRRLLVVCPSFITDCLETLEEINIRAKKQWENLGGIQLTQVACVNDHPLWIRGLGNYLNNFEARSDSC